MTDLSQQLARNKLIKGYLVQLKELTGRTLTPPDLSDIQTVQGIQARIDYVTSFPKQVHELEPDVLRSPEFGELVDRLCATNSSGIYIWLKETNDCGVLEIPSLKEFNFSADFSRIRYGVVVLLSVDLRDRLLLDIDESTIQLELQGETWSQVEIKGVRPR